MTDYVQLMKETHERLAAKERGAPAPVDIAVTHREIATAIAAAPIVEVAPQPAAEVPAAVAPYPVPPLVPNTDETTAVAWFPPDSDDRPISFAARLPWRQRHPM